MPELPQKLDDIPPETLAKLQSVVTDADGNLIYAKEQVEDLAVGLLLNGLAADPTIHVPPVVMAMLERFVSRAGIDSSSGEGTVLEQARVYLEENPPPAALKTAFSHMARERAQAAGTELGNRQVASAMVQAASDLATAQKLDALAPRSPTGVGFQRR